MRLSLNICIVLGLFFLAEGLGCTAAKEEGQYEPMRRFTTAYEQVRHLYVRDISSEELMNGAIQGMLHSLDPHSSFLNKKDLKEMMEINDGEFFGIGIEMSTDNNQLIVVSPIDDTPADKAGLRAGDVILAVDGLPTQEMTMQEAVGKIRGPKGSSVELLILHKGERQPETVAIVRDAIPLISVKARFLDDDGYLWLRLTRFNNKTVDELDEAFALVSKKAPVKGLVLDLRSNPGGLLDQSVHVSDRFLQKGTVVSMRGRGGEVKEQYKVSNKKQKIHCPVVVLINAGTASASEIVAGALQDHKRALVIGERSFGKGSVQSLIPLGDETALKLTVALYYTPNGRSIQAEGIIPDIEVPFELSRDDDGKLSRIGNTREQDLSRHLEKNATQTMKRGKISNEKQVTPVEGKNAKKAQSTLKLVEEETIKILEKDNQLRIALQMVRALPRISEIKAQ